MSRSVRAQLLAAWVVCGACGDDASIGRVDAYVEPDAGSDLGLADGASPAEAGPVTPPELPASPDPSCADGWRSLSPERAGHAVCSPWPETGPEACAPGQVQLPGATACTTIGSECPADGFPASVAARAIYVRAGAPTGGSGGRADPLATIAEALAVAVPGTTVLVAPGRYDEAPLVVPDGVVLQGACARETILGPDTSRAPGKMLEAQAGVVTIRDLTIEGPELDEEGAWAGLDVAGGSLTVEAVVIRRVAGRAIGADVGSTLAVRDVLVTDVRPGGMRGGGVAIALVDATATVERLVAERTRGAAVYAVGNEARIDLSDFVLRDVTPTSRGEAGWGVSMDRGAEATLHRGSVERASNAGLGTFAGHIVAEHIALGEVSDRPRRPFGAAGLAAIGGGRIELRHGWLLDCDTGVASEGSVTIEDVVVWSSGRYPELGAPAGAYARNGAGLVARRAVFGRGLQLGFYVDSSDVRLEDVVVEDTGTDAYGLYGNGVLVTGSSTIRGARIALRRTREVGLLAAGREASVVLTDVSIGEVQRRACADETCEGASAGVSLGSYAGASVEIDRFVVTDGAFLGVQVATGGTMDLANGLVRGHPVGANVQTEGFALDRITARVRYEDNERDFDGTALPLPAVRPPM